LETERFSKDAWTEPWKSIEGVDPPRGFAFAWFKIGNENIGVYSLHLKSNLIMHGNEELETAKNIRKREVATFQLLNHLRDVIATAVPSIKAVIIGGDFNTNKDQQMFTSEKTLSTLTDAGFRNCMEGLPLPKRVTHPGNHGFPDATFDYLFSVNAASRPVLITASNVSDHYPVTCDFTLRGENKWSIGKPSLIISAKLVSVGAVSQRLIPNGRTIWIADAQRDNGKRFVARVDEKLTAFVELEAAVRNKKQIPNHWFVYRGGSGAGAELGVGAPFSLGAVDSV
jgi:hypothetical protein